MHMLPFLHSITLILLPSLHSSTLTHPNHCFLDDQNALLRIKHDFNNSTLFSTWIPGSDCCRWIGVFCKKLPKTTTHRVNFLEINFGDDIVGTIPSSVGDLPFLDTLIIRGNPNLTGPIPPSIARLTNLDLLLLNFNSLTGPIPNFLSKLTKLVTLELNDNHLTGPIPSFLGHLPQLRSLDFSNNHLTRPIPSNLGLVPGLGFLTLTNNMLSGPIPSSLGNLNFQILELGSNQFTGDASFLFGENKTNLAHFGLEANELSFNFTNLVLPVGNLNSSLLLFSMSHNMIFGHLPVWLAEAPLLRGLDVSYNFLCGAIPTIGGNLQRYPPSIFEHNKCLCGSPLPPCKP